MLFNDIKEGTKVLIRTQITIRAGGWGNGVSATVYLEQPISRVTATQFVTPAGRFARRDGAEIGGDKWAYPVGYVGRTHGMGGDEGRIEVTPQEKITRLEYLRGTLTELEKQMYLLDRDSRALLRSLAVKGVQTSGSDDVIGLIQEATGTLRDLLKHIKK